MFEGKNIKVILSDEIDPFYRELNGIISKEVKEGTENSFHQQLLKSINRAIELVKINPQIGIQIKKKLIPKQYIKKYGITNLWKFNLLNFWRMLYTIRGEELEIIAFVIDVLDHKRYNKLFGYK